MKRILIVDDSKMIVSVLKKALEKSLDDIDILFAYTSKEALKFILKYGNSIDISILDLHLPDSKDGAIVDIAETTGIKSIVLSGILDDRLRKIISEKEYIIDCIAKDGDKSIKSTVFAVERALKNKDKNILLVDDSNVQLISALSILKKMNLNITTAKNGKEAFSIIKERKEKFSLVLTDYNMPEMDGMDLTFKLREIYDKDELGIIVLSTNDKPEVSAQFLKIGANDFINKPYSEIEFITRVNANLDLIELFENINSEYKKSLEKDNIIHEQNKRLSIDYLLRNISHHWRQPLNSISMSAGAIKLDNELDILTDDKLEELTDIIIERSEFLSNTLNTFKKLSASSGEIAEVSIKDEIEKVLDLNSFKLHDKDISIINEIPKDSSISAKLPQGCLSKVILYLIDNSYDALIKKEDVERFIKISLQKIDNKAVITIEDNGGGIKEDILPHIFEPYFTTKHQSSGVGLSLHIAKEIVIESLSGEIYAKNIKNGTAFYIEIPLNK